MQDIKAQDVRSYFNFSRFEAKRKKEGIGVLMTFR
jgi:hypothetical protein